MSLYFFIYRWVYNKHISQKKSIYYFSRYATIKAYPGNVYEVKLKLYVHVLLHRRCYAMVVSLPFPISFPLEAHLHPLSPFVCVIPDVRTSARTRDVFVSAPNSECEAHDGPSLSPSFPPSLPLSLFYPRTFIYNVHLHELHNNSRRCIDEPYIGQDAPRLHVFTQY